MLLLSVAAGTAAAERQGFAVEPQRLRVVVDWRSGVALHGIDPVAYFADGAPVPGHAAYEFSHAGAVWRFRNEGNRAAFAANPDTYTPRFGGFDPLAIARGVATPGNPLVWMIFRQKLYLFHSAENRAAFAAAPEVADAAAMLRWPRLQETIDVTGSVPADAPAPPAGLPRR